MPTTTMTPAVQVDRKTLLTALQRMSRVIPASTYKPILQAIRLEATDGVLHLSATDLDVSLSANLEAEGELPTCLVSCGELARRIKTGKAESCSIGLSARRSKLTLNGGAVDHSLPTMDLAEFPAAPDCQRGTRLTLGCQELKSALTTALVGTASEQTRYAINGVLLESDDRGVRLVATDGRRLVIVELDPSECEFRGKVILAGRLAALIVKLIDRKSRDHVPPPLVQRG